MSTPAISRDQSKSHPHSELFTVRMWREDLNDTFEWRGKVQHSGSHKECYFREREALVAFFKEALVDADFIDANMRGDESQNNE